MIEDKKIGQVILDYRFYNPELHYSDGEIEKVLLHAAAENQMEELLIQAMTGLFYITVLISGRTFWNGIRLKRKANY